MSKQHYGSSRRPGTFRRKIPTALVAVFGCEEITKSVGNYVIGQACVAILNATFAFIVMSIVGVPFALLLAFAAPKSLMPSSQITVDTPDSDSTSRSSRCPAAGPPGNGFSGPYSSGPAI